MSTPESTPQKRFFLLRVGWWVRTLARLVMAMVVLYLVVLGTLALVLTVPSIQNRLLPLAEKELTNALGAPVEVREIRIEPLDKLVLYGIRLYDKQDVLAVEAERISLGVFSLNAVEWALHPKGSHYVGLRSLDVQGLHMQLYTQARDGRNNLKRLFAGPPKPSDTTRQTLPAISADIERLQIQDFAMSFYDSAASQQELTLHPNSINYKHIQLEQVNLEASVHLQDLHHLDVALKHVEAREVLSGFYLRHLESHLFTELKPQGSLLGRLLQPRYDPGFYLHNTRIQLGETDLDLDLRMEGHTMKTLFKKLGNRRFQLHLRPSTLHFPDINAFVPKQNLPLAKTLQLSGTVQGDYTRMVSENLRLQRPGVELSAAVALENYLNTNKLQLDVDLQQSRVNPPDLLDMLPGLKLPTFIQGLPEQQVQGSFHGGLRNFELKADLAGPTGQVHANLVLGQDTAQAAYTYRGQVNTQNLKLHTILQLDQPYDLNLQASVEGSGLSLEELALQVELNTQPSLVHGWRLNQLEGQVAFENQTLDGSLSILDDKGDFNGALRVDLRNRQPVLEFDGDVQRVDLQHYGLLDEPVRLTTICNLDLTGSQLDSADGEFRLFKVVFERPDTAPADTTAPPDSPKPKRLQMEDLLVRLQRGQGLEKTLEIRGRKTRKQELFRLTLAGEYAFATLASRLQNLVAETRLFLRADSAKSNAYYRHKQLRRDSLQAAGARLVDDFDLDIDAELGNTQELMGFWGLPYRVDSGASLGGHLTLGVHNAVQLRAKAGFAAYDSIELQRLNMELNLKKPGYTSAYSGGGRVRVNQLLLPGAIQVQDVLLEPLWNGFRLDLMLKGQQPQYSNSLTLHTVNRFDGGRIRVRVDTADSYFELGGESWRFAPNFMEFHPNYLDSIQLAMYSGKQRIRVRNQLPEADPGKRWRRDVLHADISQLGLQQFAPMANQVGRMAGLVNAQVTLQDLYTKPYVVLNGKLADFQYAKLAYGDIVVDSRQNGDQVKLDARLEREGKRILELSGRFQPTDRQNALDLNLKSFDLPLNLVEPFLQDYLYQLDGQVRDMDVQVTGPLTRPILDGWLDLNARVGVDFLRTAFVLDERIRFNSESLVFEKFKLRDENGSTAELDGKIFHDGFRDFRFDLRLTELQNFQVLNTNSTHNELFWGKVVVQRGYVWVEGPLGNLNLTATLRTGNNTEFNLPIQQGQSGSSLPYVHFVSSGALDSAAARAAGAPEAGQDLGMNLNLTVNATSDALARIILDEQAGDVIEGRGSGTLSLQYTRFGDLTLTGEYIISQGSYLFNLRNLVSKRFTVQPGGRINFVGDPYSAQMDLVAVYERTADVNTLLAGRRSDSLVTTQMVPVQVLMNLKGSLLEPAIKFGLEIPSVSQDQGISTVYTLRRIENDPQELNRQVFSLLIFNRFAPLGNFAFEGAAASGASSSVTEFLSNQFTTLLNQLIGTDKLGVSVSSREFEDLYLSVRARLFNDRVTVERNGTLVSTANRDFSLGNISIRVTVLPIDRANFRPGQGRLDVEFFNRENTNFSNNIASINRGVGIIYRKDFDTFWEFIGRERKSNDYPQFPKLSEQYGLPADSLRLSPSQKNINFR